MANILDIVQYIVLHPLFSIKAFLIKLFKNFEKQVKDFFEVKDAKKLEKDAIYLLRLPRVAADSTISVPLQLLRRSFFSNNISMRTLFHLFLNFCLFSGVNTQT